MNVDEIENTDVTGEDKASKLPDASGGSLLGIFVSLVLAAVVMGIVIYFGIKSRVEASSALQRETLDMSVASVTVVHPKTSAPAEEIVLPGSMQAYTDTPI